MKLLAKFTVFSICVLLLALAVPMFGQTQDSSLEAIKAQLKQAQDAIKQQQAVIDALQQRLAALEQAKPRRSRPRRPRPSRQPRRSPVLGDLGGLKIGGTYFLSYQNGVTYNASSLSDDKTDNYSKFILKRGYLDIRRTSRPG